MKVARKTALVISVLLSVAGCSAGGSSDVDSSSDGGGTDGSVGVDDQKVNASAIVQTVFLASYTLDYTHKDARTPTMYSPGTHVCQGGGRYTLTVDSGISMSELFYKCVDYPSYPTPRTRIRDGEDKFVISNEAEDWDYYSNKDYVVRWDKNVSDSQFGDISESEQVIGRFEQLNTWSRDVTYSFDYKAASGQSYSVFSGERYHMSNEYRKYDVNDVMTEEKYKSVTLSDYKKERFQSYATDGTILKYKKGMDFTISIEDPAKEVSGIYTVATEQLFEGIGYNGLPNVGKLTITGEDGTNITVTANGDEGVTMTVSGSSELLSWDDVQGNTYHTSWDYYW